MPNTTTRSFRFSKNALALAVAIASPNLYVHAEGMLEEVVVTAAAGGRNQLESSVAVTAVNSDMISKFQPSSEAEVFRMIPGIQVAGTAGPGGNSNIAVRGLPVATGGSPFVQIQEDGLPTVLFGDIQFGNNDYWTRFDPSTAKVEGIRGGTAGVYSSQSPGAIINYVSNYGEEEGGHVQLSTGLGFDENKIDFRYGGPVSDSVNYHVGGFIRNGDGPLDVAYGASNSFQIKGNLTKHFDDNKGYMRFHIKVADTEELNYTGAPGRGKFDGKSVKSVKEFSGFDGREESNYSIHHQEMTIVDKNGDFKRVNMNGISTETVAFGHELSYEFDDNLKLDNKFRWTDMSGSFAAPFFSPGLTSDVIGSTINSFGDTVDEIRYANGPNAGMVYDNPYINTDVSIFTDIRDVGSFVNDLVLTGEYTIGDGDLKVRAGYFYMDQSIAADWHPNRVYKEVSGDNPATLDLFDDAGNKLTANGVAGFNNNWGDCCARDYDLGYVNTAPYLVLDYENDLFTVDVGYRWEKVDASGWTVAGGDPFRTDVVTQDLNGDNITVGIETLIPNGTRENLDYEETYESWTVGGLWKVNDNFSVFARASEGGRFNSDRQTVSGKINADGSLNRAGQVAAVDFVNQLEIGIKNQGEIGSGLYSVELTLLKGDFTQSTFELSATNCPGGAGGCIIDAEYESQGFELLANYFWEGLSLTGNATYSDAERKLAGEGGFSRAPSIPDLTYTISAGYEVNEQFSFGVNVTGQTDTLGNDLIEYEGGETWGANASYKLTENLEFGLQVYNLLDDYDIRGAGSVRDSSISPAFISGAPTLGRTTRASIKVLF
ncbi:TonB-dependent receptor [Pseudomaricurvus alcaniphilus]|uniref:TonB-dependent receptor n=1 Tax=Pseudomaricurvus alcaniphilus TaxID=1166482 RepID=UPI001408AC3D|nr:TonB-dependent receptor [Pseudomaricurvus alcaniphilus]NHN39154.1 TonB-dependent receptor [Pseudomaricurvus alcaniphilus]